MIHITRKYRFYAAHRNEELNDKCRNIHGHTYRIEAELMFPDPKSADGVSMVFSDIDKLIQPIIDLYDHGFMINESDKLYFMLRQYFDFKLIPFKQTTSCENLAERLYRQIAPLFEGNLISITVQETDSSIVKFTK